MHITDTIIEHLQRCGIETVDLSPLHSGAPVHLALIADHVVSLVFYYDLVTTYYDNVRRNFLYARPEFPDDLIAHLQGIDETQ